jgi:hypothetical protein
LIFADINRIQMIHNEQLRLDETRLGIPWRKWGPCLSERQWGTIREDYISATVMTTARACKFRIRRDTKRR